jgi:hypothetical protein
MRKTALESLQSPRGVLVALALAVSVLALLLLGSSAKADPPPFSVYYNVELSDYDCMVNADITKTLAVDDDPWPSAMYQDWVSFIPPEWGVADGEDIPLGAYVGEMDVQATVGWFNDPCVSPLNFSFQPMYNCTLDTSETISWDDQYFGQDGNGNGIPDGCDKYPDFLLDMFPGITPRARVCGFEFPGTKVSLCLLIFDPGTPLPDLPPFPSDRGYIIVIVSNDPTTPTVVNQINAWCPPLGTETTYYGLTLDNPGTAEDESGYAWRTNPSRAGTYTFYEYVSSIPDADGDDIDNSLDSCPYIANEGDPRVSGSGDTDEDGIDNACDPTPDEDTAPNPVCGLSGGDHDGDCYPNRQDNCPLDQNGKNPGSGALIGPNDQLDSDFDRIGDVCDLHPTTPDGDSAEVWLEDDVEIWCPPPPPIDTDGDTFLDGVECLLGSCLVDPCDDEQIWVGSGCAHLCDDVEFCNDTEAVNSTPEDTGESGTCSDGEDNDLDGYIDDIDGGCGDDTDGDGASDDGEDELGSDPEDASSTPEDASVCDVCSDGVDNDGDTAIDADDEGCAVPSVTPTATVEAVDTDGDTVPDDEETALGSDPNDPNSTPEDTSVAGTCSDGVDNDGDGLTDDDDPGCAPTVTPTETSVEDICAPVFPGTYSGLVRIDGQPAASGYEVTASIGGVEWGSAIVSAGRYAMDIPDHLPSAPPCFEGGTITFALNGMTCTASPDAEWSSGLQAVDLDCAPAAPPVTPTEVPPAPTTPAAPTVTPVSPPPSGGGGLVGSSTGLPLWALALASWAALTTVAGLGTLVAVKRR